MKSSHLRQKQTSYTSRQRFLSPYLQFRSLTGTHPALIFRCQGRIGFMVPVATPLGTEVRITGQRFIFPLKAKAVEKYTHKLVCKMGYWYSKKDYAYYVCNCFYSMEISTGGSTLLPKHCAGLFSLQLLLRSSSTFPSFSPGLG